MAKIKGVTRQSVFRLQTMGRLARMLMRSDEKEHYEAYVAMGDVQLEDDRSED